MYMSQLAYKTVAFTLILDPRPSRLESTVALSALLSISLKIAVRARPADLSALCRANGAPSYDYEFARRKCGNRIVARHQPARTQYAFNGVR